MIKNIYIFQTTLLVLALGLTGCTIGNRVPQHGQIVETTIGNIDVAANKVAGSLETTNGNISIAHHATVASVTVLNGNIAIEDFSQAQSLQTTNGNITIGENVKIHTSVRSLNGNIHIKQQAEIGQHVVTTTGNIYLARNSRIKGDIVFEKPGFWSSKIEQQNPILEINKDAKIEGKIHLYRPVELQLNQAISPDRIVRHYL